jgi:Fe-S cluster biogenesis protein NfuA
VTAVTFEEVEAALNAWARPATRSHAGDVQIVGITREGEVTVAFEGACRACPLQPVTFATAVLPALEGLAGVKGVRCETVRVSPHAMRRLRELFPSSQVGASDASKPEGPRCACEGTGEGPRDLDR